MGNYAASCMMVSVNKEETIQLVHPNGNVQIFHKPVSAGQVMQEYPQHLVCHSHSFYIRQKTPVLSGQDQLKVGNKYFLLPEQFFQSSLSLTSLASLILPPSPKAPPTPTARVSAARIHSIERAFALCQPFEIEKSDAGKGLQIRVSAEFITDLLENGRLNIHEGGQAMGTDSAGDHESRLCNSPELQKDYEQLVKSRNKRWRPKLETIKEEDKKINGQNLIFKTKRLRLDSS